MLGCGLMLAAASTEARELILQVENRIGYDSNVFRREDNSADSGFWEVAPRVTVVEANEEFNYDVRYQPVYEAYFDRSGIDGWDHIATGRASWNVTPRDTVGVDQSIRDFRQLRFDDTGLAAGGPGFEESDRDRIRWVESKAFYARAITPRFSGRLDVDYSDIDYDSRNNVDSRAFGGSVGTTYALTEITTVGLSGSGRYRNGLGGSDRPTSDSIVGSTALTITQQLTPTMSLMAQGGPSIIRNDEDDLNFGGATLNGETTTSLSFFATAEFRKEWERASFVTSYIRQESGNNGNASTSILDTVEGRITYTPWKKWRFDLLGRWSRRESVANSRNTGVGRLNADDVTQISVWARADYMLTENVMIRSYLRYYNQDRKRLLADTNYDVWTGYVAVRWVFARFKF